MVVTIAGAGVVGCSIAYELARRGATVRVLDPRGVGQGATQASAGILAPAIEGRSPELLKLLACSRNMWDGFVSRLQNDSGSSIEYERTGTLQVALDDDQSAEIVRTADRLAAMNAAHELLTAARAVDMEPSLTNRVRRALIVPGDGYVAVGPLVAALARAASARGVVFDADRVLTVHGSTSGAYVVTETNTIESDAVIVAAGSWASDLMDGTLRPAPVRPIRGQLVRLRQQPERLSHVIWGPRCYLVPWRDGSVLVGATVEDVGFDERATSAGVRELLDASRELVPALESASFEEVRVGLRPMASDELPVIGPSSSLPRVFHALGHYRNGVLLAPLTASLVADLVLEGRARDELALLRPGRVGL